MGQPKPTPQPFSKKPSADPEKLEMPGGSSCEFGAELELDLRLVQPLFSLSWRR